MNILMVGASKAAGSFTMRGRQLGASMGARVTTTPSAADWTWADVIVLVKGAGSVFSTQAQRSGRPIVWDALDFWRQPSDNASNEELAHALLKAQISVIRPTMTIGATQAMADACGGVYITHHCWSGLEPTLARATVQTVAYEGRSAYLGRWAERIEAACLARGWRFVLNPPDLQTADLVVAFRDGPWDGWMCREWKSGVKAVNALVAGRPFICQQSAAIREIQSAGSVVENVEQLEAAFDYWASWEFRTKVVEYCEPLAPTYRIEAVAAQYQRVLSTVGTSCAA